MPEPTMTPAALLQQMRWRYATKAFDPTKKIPGSTWDVIEESLVLTPSSFGLQPWKFVVVTDPATKARLQAASFNQPQVTACSHHVVFAIRSGMGAPEVERYFQRTFELRGTPASALEGYKKMMLGFMTRPREKFDVDAWATNQAYIAIGQFMAAAAMLGVDACPMEGIDPNQYNQILGLDALGCRTVVACAAGYRAPDDKYASMPKVRYSRDEIVKHV